MSLNTLVQTLAIGLRWDDSRITPGKVDELLEAYLGNGVAMVDVLQVIVVAMEMSGITGKPSASDDRPTT